MAGKSGRPKLILSPEQKEELARLSHARGSPAREVQRAQILCRFEAGETITEIARALKTIASQRAEMGGQSARHGSLGRAEGCLAPSACSGDY